MKPRVYHQYTAWLLVLCAAMACSASSRVLHIYNNHGLDRHRRDSPQQATPHAATGSTRKLSKDLLEYLKHDDSFPALSIYDTKTRALRQVQKRGRRRKRVFVDAISTSVGGAGDSSGTKGKGIRKKKKGGKSGLVGKGKGKGKSKSKSKGGSKKNSKVCKGLDFGDFYGVSGKSKESKTVKKRQLVLDRSLQLGGENCSPNILEVAQMNPNLSIFVELIMHANLEGIFMCAGPFTVLAPSNAAFLKNPSLLQSLLNPRNMEALQELLLYHIVPGLFLSADLVPGPLQTLLGEDVNVSLNPLMFNQAGVTTSDIMGCNGVIDIINDVLIPPSKSPELEVCLVDANLID